MSHPFVFPEHTCEPRPATDNTTNDPPPCPACAVKALVEWLEQEGFWRLPEMNQGIGKDFFCLSGETWRKVKALIGSSYLSREG